MTDDDLERLRAQLRQHEGLRLTVYTDTVGVPTIGYGRNLRDRGITNAEADLLLNNDIADTIVALSEAFPWFDALDSVRQRALIDMAFNVGIGGLHKSPKMLAAIVGHDYHTAAVEMLDGPWAEQVGKRATTLADMVRTGIDPGQGIAT